MAAVDGSSPSLVALGKAHQLACSLQARLHLVHVAPIAAADLLRPRGMVGADNPLLVEIEERLQGQGLRVLEEARKNVGEPSVEVTTELLLGDPGAGLCAAAAENQVDYVVIGSRGRNSLQSLLLGSVSRYVVHHCSRPVVVVRPVGEGARNNGGTCPE